MTPHKDHPDTPPGEDPIRKHVYDGIAEYDRRLPNWWLMTLYASIVFAIVYWMWDQQFPRADDESRIAASLAEIETAKLAAASANVIDDATLWQMSRNESFVSAGRAAYQTTCVSCHGDKLQGGIGFNLADATWVHGGEPTLVLKTINEGVLVKGMPAWGPVLGSKKITEITAFILSHHAPPPPET